MRAEYSIALAALLLANAASASPCPRELTEVAARVAALRVVPQPFDPPCRLIEPQALRAELDRKLRRDLPVAPELYLEALVRTSFVSGEPATLYRHLLDFYSTQVLGFYEPQADEMVIAGSPAAGVTGTMVWSHELEHAAQEHRFHLPSRLLALRGDSDRQRAASAIAEGEAMLVMFLLNSPPESGNDALALAEAAVQHQAELLNVPGVPDFFVEDLVFPYSTGLAVVLRAYRAGGWAAVDHLLSQPPTSTAALLHPERSGSAGAVAARELPAVPAGWQEMLTDTVGEWGLAFLLARRMDKRQAAEAAAGWDGDRLRLIRDRSRPERWGLAWRLRCRSVEQRAVLETALQQHLPALLERLDPLDQLRLTWTAAGRSLEVRAAWPPASPPR